MELACLIPQITVPSCCLLPLLAEWQASGPASWSQERGFNPAELAEPQVISACPVEVAQPNRRSVLEAGWF